MKWTDYLLVCLTCVVLGMILTLLMQRMGIVLVVQFIVVGLAGLVVGAVMTVALLYRRERRANG